MDIIIKQLQPSLYFHRVEGMDIIRAGIQLQPS